MHNYILVDIVEVYEASEYFQPELTGWNYVIGCYSCDKVRVIDETTFEKMEKHGLIEKL